MMRRNNIWISVLLLAGLPGCEHWTLEPEDVISDLKVEGVLDGMPFVWDASAGQMHMEANNDGATCTLPLTTESGAWELQFNLVIPASDQDVQSALESAIYEGGWPLHPGVGMDGMNLEMDDVPDDAACTMNGTPWDYEETDWTFDSSAEHVLHVGSGSGACETWTEFTWLSASDCQAHWLTEAFSVEWDDGEDQWELTPPEEDSTWAWTVSLNGPIIQQGTFYLPELSGTYVVSMASASPSMEEMAFVTRSFAGDHEDECEIPDVACELEWESHAYLSVRLVDPAGEVYATSMDCGQPAGEFEAVEVSDFAPNASGVPTRLVRFDCSLELLNAAMDPVQLDVEAGQIAFPLHD